MKSLKNYSLSLIRTSPAPLPTEPFPTSCTWVCLHFFEHTFQIFFTEMTKFTNNPQHFILLGQKKQNKKKLNFKKF